MLKVRKLNSTQYLDAFILLHMGIYDVLIDLLKSCGLPNWVNMWHPTHKLLTYEFLSSCFHPYTLFPSSDLGEWSVFDRMHEIQPNEPVFARIKCLLNQDLKAKFEISRHLCFRGYIYPNSVEIPIYHSS